MKNNNKYNAGLKVSRAISSLIFLVPLIMIQSSCKKLVEVAPPVTSINVANVYTNAGTAAAVLTGIYSKMVFNSIGNGGITSASFLSGLSSDELTLFSGVTNISYFQYYTNSLNTSTNTIDFWVGIYPITFACNSAIEGLNNSNSLPPAVKQQLLGEAKFARAFCYFYLVNLYGDVPLAVSTDWQMNAALARAPKVQVWQQIIADLKDAQNLLSSNYLMSDAVSIYLTSSAERVRPTKWAANALLARTYLYQQQWDSAEVQATAIINNKGMYDTVSLNNVFLKNTKEAIWQMQPVSPGINTIDAQTFILPNSGPSNPNYPVYLNVALVNAFEAGDQRKVNWVGSVTPPPGSTTYYYPYKYKATTLSGSQAEYITALRLGEQYLIRAEARAQQGNVSGAQSDLNTIRTRAGLANTSANDKPSLLTAIVHERQVELFTEWGHRWLDLKRTGNIDAIMGTPGGGICAAKGGSWNTNWQWYPIPLSELQKAPQLVQNTGY